ncbi:alpha/beta hydrolase, partial [Herbaspirillum lusitanum]|uniref:alpha/beta hydrolase n=1 Tax=Herbaspirillum lusitanum TaxID=213312 RepID=UPI0039BF3FCE
PLAAAGGPAIYTLTPEQARNLLAGAQSGKVAKPAADIEDRVIPVGPTGSTRIRVLRPQGNKETLPVVMYFHGAGWVMGDVNTHDRLVRQIVDGAKVAVNCLQFNFQQFIIRSMHCPSLQKGKRMHDLFHLPKHQIHCAQFNCSNIKPSPLPERKHHEIDQTTARPQRHRTRRRFGRPICLRCFRGTANPRLPRRAGRRRRSCYLYADT